MDSSTLIQLTLGFIGAVLSIIGAWIGANLNKLTESVQSLNSKMAVIIERTDSHEKRIDRLEKHKRVV